MLANAIARKVAEKLGKKWYFITDRKKPRRQALGEQLRSRSDKDRSHSSCARLAILHGSTRRIVIALKP